MTEINQPFQSAAPLSGTGVGPVFQPAAPLSGTGVGPVFQPAAPLSGTGVGPVFQPASALESTSLNLNASINTPQQLQDSRLRIGELVNFENTMVPSTITVENLGEFSLDEAPVLGRGSFGLVLKYGPVALKITRIPRGHQYFQQIISVTENEQAMSRYLKDCPHIVPYYGAVRYEMDDAVVFYQANEVMDGDFNGLNITLSPLQVSSVLRQVIEALECLNNLGVVHNDIKGDNVMYKKVSTGYKAFLADMGCVSRIGHRGMCSSKLYASLNPIALAGGDNAGLVELLTRIVYKNSHVYDAVVEQQKRRILVTSSDEEFGRNVAEILRENPPQGYSQNFSEVLAEFILAASRLESPQQLLRLPLFTQTAMEIVVSLPGVRQENSNVFIFSEPAIRQIANQFPGCEISAEITAKNMLNLIQENSAELAVTEQELQDLTSNIQSCLERG